MERLTEAGIEPSVCSRDDSYDNALAVNINGLYKMELIHRRGPWKTKESLELATLEWAHWFTTKDYLNPSVIPLRQKLRQATTGTLPVKPPQRHDLN